MATDTVETLDARFEIRLKAGEKELFAKAADLDGRSVSNWARLVLLTAAKEATGKKETKRR